jgi:hypothetical protein
MQSESDSGSMEATASRQARLDALIRECLAKWDPEAIVRSAIRPDGKLDITVVSRRFEGRDSREREADFWPALDLVPKPEMVYLTYCLLLTPEEAERSFGVAPAVTAMGENWDE